MADVPARDTARPNHLAVDPLPCVLLVDDDPDILRVVQFYLKKQRYQVLTASDGEEALRVLREHPDVELVLSDVMMPGINGLELLQEIRANPRLADLSVVLISAEGQTAKKVAGLNLGADDYITKPFNFDELLARVRNHIRLRRLQREVVLKNDLLHAKNEQFSNDLEHARSVQLALMPDRLPEHESYRVGARYVPLERVGGDFFDVIELDDGEKLGLLIADVCGHGIAAAFVTVMTKLAFRNVCFTYRDPAIVLARMNQQLLHVLNQGFVTAFYAVLDVPSLTLSYAGGGHPPLLVSRVGDPSVIELESQSTFLGCFEQVELTSGTFQFQSGDRLLLYTDGVYESHNASGEAFGTPRIAELMQQDSALPIQQLVNRIVFKLFDFMGEASLEDDVTLLGLEIDPGSRR